MKNPFRRDADPFAPSRFGGGAPFRSVRTRERKHMRHSWQWWLLGGFVVLTLLAGWGIWRYLTIQGIIQKNCPACAPEAPGRPFNVLLVGSDSRGDLTPEEQQHLGADAVAGARADTLILGHVDPASDRVIMVQFPRDLWVPVAGKDEERKIGEVRLYGRNTLVRTVEDLTGVDINRYVEINIAGFRDVVDAIGGVEVCVPETIPFDAQTGLEVTKPGTIRFDGDSALRFVRSRKVFAGGDIDRIANQQKFLSAALREVTSAGTLLRPQRILDLIRAAQDNLTIDDKTSLPAVRRILERFRSFDPAHYEAYVAPNLGLGQHIYPSGQVASIVRPDTERIRLVGDAIRRNESPGEADGVPSIDPKTINVGVYNGIDLNRRYASEAADALVAATGGRVNGLQIADIANAPRFGFTQTLIRYEEPAASMAELVAALLPQAELQERKTPDGVDVAVIVGDEDLEVKTLLQILPIPLQKPGDEPEVCKQEGEMGDPIR